MTPARHDKSEVAALHSDLQANIFVGTHTLQKERNDPSGGCHWGQLSWTHRDLGRMRPTKKPHQYLTGAICVIGSKTHRRVMLEYCGGMCQPHDKRS